jgi:hypothetical protein
MIRMSELNSFHIKQLQVQNSCCGHFHYNQFRFISMINDNENFKGGKL